MSDGRKRLVLDLDTGVDDALALAYALGSPEVELVGVVCTYGNVTMRTAVRNTCALLELLGHPEVPVLAGADRALAATSPFAPPAAVRRIHGENGLGDQPVSGRCRCAPGDGVAFLRDELRRAEGDGAELVYVPTGPLTNLAHMLTSIPGLADALGRVTFMGGALAVPGNVTPCAEANVANDPAAADAVLRGGLRTRMVGLDVTHQAVLARDDTAAWRELGTPAGIFLADVTDHYISVYEENNPLMGGCALHDPLAVAAAIDPSLVGRLPTNLRVDLEGPTRGRTVCDPDRLRDEEKTCEVALTVDVPRFLGEFRARVARALA
ncbi:nucleoside hydrolase [Olsenella sp. DSM 107455]|uniref:Nucleoside hydrolase n=1 Tax=Thermophilibacter gallinarum TaxID=2779357 RepID=A0ABR9QQK9_9ACTN|nr:nucleoside hydrolase [Thermophilibacter gallinarum]MBE5023353.1 nucleoside hydrolase [Thermophilibacter gallinarum]